MTSVTFLDVTRFRCESCVERSRHEDDKAREMAERDRQRAEEYKRRRLLAVSGIEPRFIGMTFSDYQPPTAKAREVLAQCQAYAANFNPATSGNLLMIGGCGTGKNMLSSIIGQAVIASGYSSVHTTAMKLVRRIKASWGRDSTESEQAAIDTFVEPDLLVIDEIGVQFGSPTEQLFINEVVNDRYGANLPTILIGNLTLKQVEDTVGQRVVDRFFEKPSRMLGFDWKSYRRTGA